GARAGRAARSRPARADGARVAPRATDGDAGAGGGVRGDRRGLRRLGPGGARRALRARGAGGAPAGRAAVVDGGGEGSAAGRAVRLARPAVPFRPRALLLDALAVGALHGARELDARRDADLAEDVAQVRLDRLLAEEQLGGDLRIRLAVDDEPGELELAGR